MTQTAQSTFALPGLAVSGKAGVGKTTFANLVAERLKARGAVAAKVSFATELKREVAEVHGLRKGQPGWREAAVAHGALRRRTDGPDYWVRRTLIGIGRLLDAGYTPLVDDLRLTQELQALRGHEFHVARLDAPAALRAARLRRLGLEPAAAYSTDATECALDDADFDVRFQNGADIGLDDLRKMAEQFVALAVSEPALALAS